MKPFFLASFLTLSFSLSATTYTVTSTSSDPGTVGTLPYYILNSAAGDTIQCTIPGNTLTLTQSLPAINHSLIISATSPLTINAGGAYQAFSVASGTVSLTNFIIEDAASIGGAGGVGYSGGGGAVGGGPGVYVHDGANVTLSMVQFTGNSATGGVGGASATGSAANTSGGGGGGFAGGAGGGTVGNPGGAGGGGNSGGGDGGRTGSVAGGAATAYTFGGGGGAAATGTGGAAAAGGMTDTIAGGMSAAGGGGGGAGAGGAGSNATPTAGGAGGAGVGTDASFGGGGGGSGSAGFPGGAGTGTAGGGGGGASGSTVGGAGGLDGGGGGGGQASSGGGKGGFGAGGGGSNGGTVAGTLFGGGTGTITGEGGGGAALGGAIFIQNGATLTIGDGYSATGSVVTAGANGGGGTTAVALGQDIFLRSGGSLIFNLNATGLTIATTIDSDQGAGGGTGGGLTLMGSKTLTLSAANTYSGGTTITAGTLNISSDTALGQSSTGVSIAAGTLQAGASFTSSRAISLTGAASVDTQAFTMGLSGVISGSGSLQKLGTGTLSLSNTNLYSGGTTITAGILSVGADTALGNSAGGLTIGTATFQASSSFTSARTITLTGTSTIDTQANTLTLSGAIGGSTSLTKIGTGTLILSGANDYSGGTTISAGTVNGNTTSLQGNIQDNAALIFNQTSAGTYAGVLSGNGTLTLEGGGTLTLTGTNTFSGTTAISAGTLTVDGALASSAVTVALDAVLSGSGSVGAVTNNGTVQPGDGSTSFGTLTVTGNFTPAAGSLLTIDIGPLDADLLAITGSADFSNSQLSIVPLSGFYGLTANYTIVTSSSNGLSGTFSSPITSTSSNFQPSVTYSASEIELLVKVINPFLDFPFANKNITRVANNIAELNLSNLLTPDLESVIDSFAGQSDAAINAALDQMHPAQYSAFTELQGEVGGQILSFFHRKPNLICCCPRPKHFWIEPFGNWFDMRSRGDQVGFNADTKGVAFGADREVSDFWAIGIGGVWDECDLGWSGGRGHAKVQSGYGAFYTDFKTDNFYFGGSLLGGLDFYHVSRHIAFFTTDRIAEGRYRAVDAMGQLSAAYFFGAPACHLFPYTNLDFFYLRQSTFAETGADGLNLDVGFTQNGTFRGELGMGLEIQDTNVNQTMCISPLVALGWVIQQPIYREPYTANFEGEPITFQAYGWDETWQLFAADFGLSLSYKTFSLTGEYRIELSPGANQTFYGQRGNIRLDWKW